MSRLTYSSKGGLRALQISSARVFIFVEGGLDRTYADRVLRITAKHSEPHYQVRSIKEHSGTGGKQALLKLFRLLRSKSMLEGDKFGKPFYSIFLLDKDADDLTRRIIGSKHILYTNTYDLEGQLFLSGDIHQALADACLITHTQAKSWLPDKQAFSLRVASVWSDWVALCLLSARLKINCGCTYDRPSAVNDPALAVTDYSLVDAFKVSVALRKSLTTTQVEKRLDTVRQHHFSSIDCGMPFRYFKGKWLGHILDAHISEQTRIPDSTTNAVFDRMLIAIVAQVNSQNATDYWPKLINSIGEAEDHVFAA